MVARARARRRRLRGQPEKGLPDKEFLPDPPCDPRGGRRRRASACACKPALKILIPGQLSDSENGPKPKKF